MNRHTNRRYVFSDEIPESTNEKQNEVSESNKSVNKSFFLVPKGNIKKRKKSSHKGSHKHLKRWQKVIIIVLCVLIAIALAAIGTVAVLLNTGKSDMTTKIEDVSLKVPDNIENHENGEHITYKGDRYMYNENLASILFMGVDKRDFETEDDTYGQNGDADALMLLVYDTKTSKSTLVSISRETIADVEAYSTEGKYVGTKKEQICLAYSYGDGKEKSCENEVAAVRRLFYNVPINSYVALDLDGISYMNDAVGGVELTPIETFRNFTEGETVTLWGKDAESYVRYRDTTKLLSNNSRMKRQKQYLNAFFNQLVTSTKADVTTLLDLYNAASPYMMTNVGANKAAYLASEALQNNFNALNMQNVPGEVKMGEKYAEYHIDEDAFFEMFLNIFYVKLDK